MFLITGDKQLLLTSGYTPRPPPPAPTVQSSIAPLAWVRILGPFLTGAAQTSVTVADEKWTALNPTL